MPANELADDVLTDDGTLDVTAAGKALRMGAHGIRKAVREGRLRRCNGSLGPPRFTREEIEKFAQARERGSGGPIAPSEEMQLAAADTIGGMLQQAQGHAGDFARIALEILKNRDATTERERSNLMKALLTENDRLTKRVESLESARDELNESIDLLRKQQYDDKIAAAEVEGIKKKTATAIGIARLVIPSVIARVIGGEQLNQGAMMAIIESLTNEQRDSLMQSMASVLTADQFGSLATLLAQWGAKETKKAPPSEESGAPAATPTG